MNKKINRILVIDDDVAILEACNLILTEAGYATETAIDPGTFLHHGELPDLIVLDAILSNTDGKEICKRLKNDQRTKHIPVIMMSAHPNIQDFAKNAGADAYIDKPFNMEDLLKLVQHYFPNVAT